MRKASTEAPQSVGGGGWPPRDVAFCGMRSLTRRDGKERRRGRVDGAEDAPLEPSLKRKEVMRIVVNLEHESRTRKEVKQDTL